MLEKPILLANWEIMRLLLLLPATEFFHSCSSLQVASLIPGFRNLYMSASILNWLRNSLLNTQSGSTRLFLSFIIFSFGKCLKIKIRDSNLNPAFPFTKIFYSAKTLKLFSFHSYSLYIFFLLLSTNFMQSPLLVFIL